MVRHIHHLYLFIILLVRLSYNDKIFMNYATIKITLKGIFLHQMEGNAIEDLSKIEARRIR